MPAAAAAETRLVARDPLALHELRSDVLGSVGPANGAGVLYAVGFLEGQSAALRQLDALGSASPGAARGCAAPSFLLFSLDGGELPRRFWGHLSESLEARPTLPGDPAGCWVSAGYAAGWYSELLGQTILVREVACCARGAPQCRFEGRPLAAWLSQGDGFAGELLPYLDFPSLRERARALAAGAPFQEPAEGADAGYLLGELDPCSPAVHVWGPLAIVPYGGCADAERALANLLADTEEEPVRSAVIDLGGARIDALELCGLAQLLQHLRDLDVAAVLAGLAPVQEQLARASGELFRGALYESDLQRAIALAFQLCQDPRGA
jgi:hypothetical protein